MRVVAMIFAFLLILFEGGCTVAFLLAGMPGELFGFWFILGLVPLAIGIMLGRSAGKSGKSQSKPVQRMEEKDWPP